MPMDIRKFFAVKGAAGGGSKKKGDKDKKQQTKTNSSNSSSNAAASKKKSGTPSKAARKPSAVLSPIAEEGTRNKKKRRSILEDSDTDATTDGAAEDVEDTKKVAKKKITNDDNDDSSVEEQDQKPKAGSSSRFFGSKKKKSTDNKPKNLKEISADDYFASASSSATKKRRSSPRRSSKPKGSYVEEDNDDNDDDLMEEESDVKPPSNNKRKKAPDDDDDDFEDDGNDMDEDLEADDDNVGMKKRASPKAAKNPPTKPVRKPSPSFKKPKWEASDDDDDDDHTKKNKVISVDSEDDNDDHDKKQAAKPTPTPTRGKNKRAAEKPPVKATEEAKSPPSSKKRKTTRPAASNSSSKKKATPTAKKEKETTLEPTLELEEFDVDKAEEECLEGLTFVFTGVLEPLSRDDATDYVKSLGGKVTTSVSGRTSYLVVGEVLEDGRPYDQGKKYQTALEKANCKIVMGVKKLYGLAKLYSDKKQASKPPEEEAAATSAPSAAPASAKKPAFVNPYAKKAGAVANPYAKKSNPYAKKSNNPYATSSSSAAKQVGGGGPARKPGSSSNDLWVDKYAPTSTQQILGNKDCVNKLTIWLAKWESRFNNDKAAGKAFSNPHGPWKAALLSGPPGIGKTTTATLVGKEAGRDVLEFNASDVRSKKYMQSSMGDITGSQSVEAFLQQGNSKTSGKGKSAPVSKKRVIIMDEVDGMGGGDRGGMAELIQMIKHSRTPIICICNDRQSQKMKSLVPYCLDLRFKRPLRSQIAKAAVQVAQMEGMAVQPNAAEQMAESCGNDIRQVINAIQMWASDNRGNDSNALTYKGLKEREKTIKKDDILRVNIFEASKLILEGRRGLAKADPETERDSFFKRNDAFFVDYSFTGLIVQQNYLKVMGQQFLQVKRKNDAAQILDSLEQVHSAAQSMSDYSLVENKIRGGSDMNWSLLPFSGALAVKTGFHAAGPTGSGFPGFPEFTSWLGRNSSKSKKARIIQELNHHMNYRISGGTQEVRLSYIPFLRQRFLTQLKDSEEDDRNAVAIRLMDEYGLDRDDVFENLDEFNMNPKAPKIADLDSKSKAAFTREFNAGSHKSQALVAEQGAPTKKRRKAAASSADPDDPDAINDDVQEEESDVDDDDDLEEMKKAFSKKKRKGGGGKGKGAAATSKSKAGKRKSTGRGKK